MQFNLVRPCAQCPFRSDLPDNLKGWLDHRKDELAMSILTKGFSFSCHKTLNPDDPSTESMCAGALIMQIRSNALYNNPGMRFAAMSGLLDVTKVDMQSPVFESTEDFVNFHTIEDEQGGDSN